MTNAGSYTVVANAAGGSTTSSVAALTVYFPLTLTATNHHPGIGLVLNLTGPPEESFIVEMSTNILFPTAWLPLSTNWFDETGAGQFIDFSATNDPQRFYRTLLGQ